MRKRNEQIVFSSQIVGWGYWIKGRPEYEITTENGTKKAPIKPYRFFQRRCLPESQRTVFRSSWKPIFEMMMECNDITIPKDPGEINTDFIQRTFDLATAYLKTRVSYIWSKTKSKDLENWRVSTWSAAVAHGRIARNGTDEDLLRLPPKSKGGRPKKTRFRQLPLTQTLVQPTLPPNVPVLPAIRQDLMAPSRNVRRRIAVEEAKNDDDDFRRTFGMPTMTELEIHAPPIDEVVLRQRREEHERQERQERQNLSNDPSLLVRRTSNDGGIPDSSRTTASTFSRLLDAAAAVGADCSTSTLATSTDRELRR